MAANTFNDYTPQQIGDVAIELVTGGLRLASLVSMYGPDDFKEGRGRTVYLNVPGVLISRDRSLDEVTTAIVLDSLQETQEPISLSTHALSAVGMSEHDLSLGIQDFAKQVLAPQADAVADRIEKAVADALAGVAEDTSITYSASDPVAAFTAGRRALRAKGIDVAAADLVAVVGGNVADDLLDSGSLDYGKTGTADALRNGAPGRVRGFEVIESGRIGDDEIVFFPRDGVYVAVRAPEVPLGAAFGETVRKERFSLRYLRDYDALHTQDRSIVSTFLAAGVMPLYEVTRDYAAGTASATEVPGGAVVRVNTAA